MITFKNMHKLSEYLWEITQDYSTNMRVSARVYATKRMLEDILGEKAVEQLINMTTLPGIEKYALAMPDIHQGYGFPIGGVAAFREEDGIISPGGVGYDINCGVRLLLSQTTHAQIKDSIDELVTQIFSRVPSGVGSSGNIILKSKELDAVLKSGVNWAIRNHYATENDAEFTEENGCLEIADSELVSERAKERGKDQLGTLGSGNHFLEIQEVIEIFDQEIAKIFGLFQGQIAVMIHTGSRGLGHQVCTDYVRLMNQNKIQYKIDLVDRELACAPFNSREGQDYFRAMAAAANFAWTNRQLISYEVREAWKSVFGLYEQNLILLYDVAHNIAKQEIHDGKKLIVHRKGATRAFAPGAPDIPNKYQSTGQPVLIPGSMGTHSYVLAGTQGAMQNTFGSACHGAGRSMSRMQSKRTFAYNTLMKDMHDLGITVRCDSFKGILEEAPGAYKNIEDVIDVVCGAQIATKIAKLRPVGVVKG